MTSDATDNPTSRKKIDDRPYPPLEGRARVIGTIALSAAVFMNVLDSSITNVSIPTISGDLGVSAIQGTWVITSFAVSNAITVPLTGWLTQRLGQVRLFVVSIFLFVVASWLCGFAWSLGSLVVFRVIQGAVAGPMVPLSQSLMLATYPKQKAGMAMALWSMTILVGPVAGPLLGGWISDNYNWPWIFYINIPVGILAGWATWRLYHKRDSERSRRPIDTMGLGLLVVWVGALQIMLDKGKELDWFSSTTIVILAAVAVMAFVFFIIWELTEKHPIVDLTLFKERNFTSATITLSVAFGVFFGTVVLLPLWMQNTLGYTATDAGIASAPVGILAIVLSPVVGKLLGKYDPRMITTVSFLIFALISYMRSRFNVHVDLFTIMVPTFIQGAAMAAFFIPLTTITLSGLDHDRVPAAAGLSSFMRLVFRGFSASIATTLWQNRATLHHARLTAAATPGEPAFDAATSGLAHHGFSAAQSNVLINNLINQKAFTMGATDIFYASAILFLVLIGLIWFARPDPVHSAPGPTPGIE